MVVSKVDIPGHMVVSKVDIPGHMVVSLQIW